MITYKNFIGEIVRLAAEGRKLRNARRMHEDTGFRKWRNELQSLLNQIVQVGYLLPCPVMAHNRSFGYSRRITSDDELMATYRRDMDDTVNELKVIIDSFEKHGEPPKGGRSSADLEVPKVVTLSWLYDHTSIAFWAKVLSIFVAIVVAAFSAGVYIGQSNIYNKAASLFDRKQSETNAKE